MVMQQTQGAAQKTAPSVDQVSARLSEYQRAVDTLVDIDNRIAALTDQIAALKQERVSAEVAAVAGALDAITKRPGENYNDYLFRVKQNPLARAVKVLDITHNMDIRRIPNPTQKDRERVELKYGKALAYLLSE